VPGAVAYFQLQQTVHRWRSTPLPPTATGMGEPSYTY
jgi:hypothetical protein